LKILTKKGKVTYVKNLVIFFYPSGRGIYFKAKLMKVVKTYSPLQWEKGEILC
jgi:hypothetical protein